MPHLTPTAPGTASTDIRLGFGIPGYAHPLMAPVEWAELTRPGTPLALGRPERGGRTRGPPRPALPGSGGQAAQPGRTGPRPPRASPTAPAPSAVCPPPTAISTGTGRRVLPRPLPDRAGGPPRGPPHRSPRCAPWRGAHIVLGHGTHPYAGIRRDRRPLVTFSGPWSDYRWSRSPSGPPTTRPCASATSCTAYPAAHLDEALRIARWQGAADDLLHRPHGRGGAADPWEAMPGYWDDIVSRVGTGVSE